MTILDEASQLTSQDRQAIYGHPIDDFTKITTMAEPILASDIDPRLKHALYMVQVKVARLLNTPDHHDSIVDLAGYANTYAMVLDKIAEETKNDTGPKNTYAEGYMRGQIDMKEILENETPGTRQ